MDPGQIGIFDALGDGSSWGSIGNWDPYRFLLGLNLVVLDGH
jgi:hypothetical protein